ncbi:MAG: class I SAM-dependent methyltransferase [Candidatus Thorarchaeota archaeon]
MERTPDSIKDYECGYEGVAEFYDLFASNVDLRFYLEYAKKQGSPVLDIAAGTGRVAIALAEAGFSVHALEKSPSMLSVFKEKIADHEIADLITIHEADMTNFRLDIKFPLIIIPASFGHALTRAHQLSALHAIKNHLRQDAIFILDLYVGEHLDEHSSFQDGPVTLPDGRVVKRYGEMRVDKKRTRMTLNLRFEIFHDSHTLAEERLVHSGTAVINRDDANSLIQDAGFRIQEEFGDFEKNSFTEESGRRIMILTH